jgi:hypothetical protein
MPPAGLAITCKQACLRSAVFVGLPAILDIVSRVLPTPEARSLAFIFYHLGVKMLFPYFALVSTMRRSNGYMGLHEVLSRTRVMAVRELGPIFRVESLQGDATILPVFPTWPRPCRVGAGRLRVCLWGRAALGEGQGAPIYRIGTGRLAPHVGLAPASLRLGWLASITRKNPGPARALSFKTQRVYARLWTFPLKQCGKTTLTMGPAIPWSSRCCVH